jgi:cytochrome c-type biogenesis protein CcmE
MTLSRRARRLLILLAATAAVAAAGYGVLRSFQDNLVFFYTPSQIASGAIPAGAHSYRLGGMVEQGSLAREPGTLNIRFRVTDLHHSVAVHYRGVVPDLFREGKGVVAQGRMEGGQFRASEILAKHDENYQPPVLGTPAHDR